MLGVLLLAQFALIYVALMQTSATHVAILFYLQPIFTAMLAHRYLPNDVFTLRTGVGLMLGLAGTAFTLTDNDVELYPTAIIGDLLAVGSAFLWALHTVYTKRVSTDVDPFTIVFYSTGLSAIGLSSMSAALETPVFFTPSWRVLLALAYQGVVVAAVGGVAWVVLVRKFRTSALSTYTFLTPAFGVAASIVLLGAPFSAKLLLGLGLVLCALVCIDLPPTNPNTAVTQAIRP